ncbi:hypothetical protein FSW04_07000 [Baekduia soli]|uniref:Uncharacterized protein n=1 Tax=Baekduia soli TaxID=496014 RepID=A0A5B8U2W0_9ACTN|nr:hypothetical protein [Baekduia soli]QEC47354.1 hypothetical protein FSW04_07000 [Baekduia soli]
MDLVLRSWQDRAAVRAEHCLEPTLRRRIDRIPQRLSDRRRLRRQRRQVPRDVGTAIDDASRRMWGQTYRP